MSHNIWKIGLFERIKDTNTADCIECRTNKEHKYNFQLSKGSITGLKIHLEKKYSGSEYSKKYEALETKKSEASTIGGIGLPTIDPGTKIGFSEQSFAYN
jgi:hypothetical protein